MVHGIVRHESLDARDCRLRCTDPSVLYQSGLDGTDPGDDQGTDDELGSLSERHRRQRHPAVNNQGMGEANFNSFFDIFATANIRHDQTGADKFTASGQQRIITGNVSDNTKGFRVTLAWTDAPGPTSGNAFVNNLDLEVTVGGNTYKGNVFSGANSVTGGLADTRNNVESIFIPAGVSGSFIVKVKGTNIAGNGVPGDADPLDQDYALVIYNANEAALPVINRGSTVITAESCAPGNNAVDPGETVTINFGLSNIGTANTTRPRGHTATWRWRQLSEWSPKLRRSRRRRTRGFTSVHVYCYDKLR